MAISISTRIFVALTGSVKSIFLSVGKTPETSRIRMPAGLTRREMVGKGERMQIRTPARLTPSRVDFFTLLQKRFMRQTSFSSAFLASGAFHASGQPQPFAQRTDGITKSVGITTSLRISMSFGIPTSLL